MAKPKPFKMPTSDAAKADALFTTRVQRLELQKQVDALAAIESQLKEHFINHLSKDSRGAVGKVALVKVTSKVTPTVEDWPKFYAHIKKTGNFELLGRRLSEAAVVERWEAKKEVPGVGRFNAKSVSCTAVK